MTPVTAKRPAASRKQKSQPSTRDSVPTSELQQQFEYYLSLYCYNQSEKTLRGKKDTLAKLLWFLEAKGHERFDKFSAAAFLAYVRNGHHDPQGRWGIATTDKRASRAVRPRTVQLYFIYLQGFCRALVQDGTLDASPLDQIQRPGAPQDPVRPFNESQIRALLDATSETSHPARDKAILVLMLDTGLRASELCGLRYCDLDLPGHSCVVKGKGEKIRIVSFGDAAAQALMAYTRGHREQMGTEEPLFPRDTRGGGPMSPNGLRMLFRRLGARAGLCTETGVSLSGARVSPHTARHSFAVLFTCNGASQRATMMQMGHKSVDVHLKYQNIAEAQLASQHRAHSPMDNLMGKGKRKG